MIEYVIAAGIGAGLAIAHSVYEEYQINKLKKKRDKLIDDCCDFLDKLSQLKKVNKMMKILEEKSDLKKFNRGENNYYSYLAGSLKEI